MIGGRLCACGHHEVDHEYWLEYGTLVCMASPDCQCTNFEPVFELDQPPPDETQPLVWEV